METKRNATGKENESLELLYRIQILWLKRLRDTSGYTQLFSLGTLPGERYNKRKLLQRSARACGLDVYLPNGLMCTLHDYSSCVVCVFSKLLVYICLLKQKRGIIYHSLKYYDNDRKSVTNALLNKLTRQTKFISQFQLN